MLTLDSLPSTASRFAGAAVAPGSASSRAPETITIHGAEIGEPRRPRLHVAAALVGVCDAGGQPIVSGRRVAAFSNEEEDAVGLTGVVPFALETRLRELGARYERGPKWGAFAVRDGKLVTGQNPQSSAETAREVLAALG